VLVGLGFGCVFTPSIGVATTGVDPRQAGIAAATANTAMQIGSSVGTAVLNTVAVDATRDFVGPPTAALVHGFATATGGAAVAMVVGAALVAAFLRPASARAHQQTTGGH
jgi:hypothetical protein